MELFSVIPILDYLIFDLPKNNPELVSAFSGAFAAILLVLFINYLGRRSALKGKEDQLNFEILFKLTKFFNKIISRINLLLDLRDALNKSIIDPSHQFNDSHKSILKNGIFIKDLIQEMQFSPTLNSLSIYIELDQIISFLDQSKTQILTKKEDPKEYYKEYHEFLLANITLVYLNVKSINSFVQNDLYISDKSLKSRYTENLYYEVEKLTNKLTPDKSSSQMKN